jgi:hypothetical protein
MLRVILLFISLTFFSPARADTLVLFIPSPDDVYRQVFGYFYHTALCVNGEWWEAHPYYGVHRNSGLERVQWEPGVRVLRSPMDIPFQRARQLQSLEGTPFDLHSKWGDTSSFNCTELVAFALNKPHYAIPITEDGFKKGELGLSPDRLYQMLIQDGFRPVSNSTSVCHDLLMW